MIVYSPCSRLNLTDFGILIPLRDERVDQILKHVRSVLGPGAAEFLRELPCEPAAFEDLRRAHSEAYLRRLLGPEPDAEVLRVYEAIDADGRWNRFDPALRRRPFTELVRTLLGQVSVVLEASDFALQRGWCYVLGGGAHHAMFDHGAGFCLVNDIVIAIRRLQAQGRIHSAWVIDTDAHKGDGTAALTADDPTIRTLSIHMAHGWPLDDPSRLDSQVPSTVDIPIEPGEEGAYLGRLEGGLQELRAGGVADFAVVVAGSDPFEGDELESTQQLRLGLDQMLARDRLVFEFLEKAGLPQLWLMAGGYGLRVWEVHARFLEWVLERKKAVSA